MDASIMRRLMKDIQCIQRHLATPTRCRVVFSYVYGENPSRIAAHFYIDFAGVSGPLLTSRRRYFRSGRGFHLRRAIDGQGPGGGSAAGGRRPTAMTRRCDRSSTRSGPDGERPGTDRAPTRTTQGSCDVVETSYDASNITPSESLEYG